MQKQRKFLMCSLFIFFFCFNSGYANNLSHSNSQKYLSHFSHQPIETVLDFWFDYANHAQPLYERAVWWEKNPEFDEIIRQHFLNLREDAIQGKLDGWLNTPRGTLAYIVLVDQFSRHLFRDTPQMYQYDHLALNAAMLAVSRKFDQSLSLNERVFLYMPFEHSEELKYQKQSLKLFKRLLKETPLELKPIAEKHLRYANEHYEIIEKFHRFPHRNIILGRTSTPTEVTFLQTHQGW